MKTKKVIIAGGRDFNNYKKLCKFCNKVLKDVNNIKIVSGGTRGADNLGESYAKEKGYKIKMFPADWDKHKRAAGYIRNEQMAKYSDMLIAFWDGESSGTKHMINLAKVNKLEINICKYKQE